MGFPSPQDNTAEFQYRQVLETGRDNFQLNHFDPPSMGVETSGLSLDGYWPTHLPLAAEPYRDEYAVGRDDIRIIRVAGVGAGLEHRVLPPYVVTLRPDREVRLIPEPENPFDGNAIRVEAADGGDKAGYIPRVMNVEVSAWWNEFPDSKAWVLSHWVDHLMQVLWDSLEGGGSGSPVHSMHLVLARSESVAEIEPAFAVHWET